VQETEQRDPAAVPGVILTPQSLAAAEFGGFGTSIATNLLGNITRTKF
jgi:hypothetical protein